MRALTSELQLTRVLARVTPVWHVLTTGALAAWLVLQSHGDPYLNQGRATTTVRVALVVLALGAAFALDDPSEHDLAGTPVSVATRRTIRIVLTLLAVAAVWWGLLALASAAPALTGGPAAVMGVEAWAEMNGGTAPEFTPPPDTAALLPWAALTLELAAVLAVVLGVAAWGTRRSADRSGGLIAAPVTLATVVLLALAPARWSFLPPWAPSPLTAGHVTDAYAIWLAAHQRVAVVGLIGLVLLATGSRDLARRPLRGRSAAGTGATHTRLAVDLSR